MQNTEKKKVANNAHSVPYKGILYHSLKECCERNGKVYNTVVRRLRAGKSLEEAMEEPVITPSERYKGRRMVHNCKPIKLNGIIYPSIALAAEAAGTDVKRCYNRLQRSMSSGVTYEDIFDLTDRFSNEKVTERSTKKKSESFSRRQKKEENKAVSVNG